MIPLYMAIGNPGLLVTLVALSQGAGVTEIGAISATGSVVNFFLSMFWGSLSDASAQRKKFRLAFSILLVPLFIGLSLAVNVTQITLLYALVVAFSCGIAPVAVMYTVECCKGKNWSIEVSRFNSIMSIGNIIGLLACTFAAGFFSTSTLFYISTASCLIAVIMLWRLGE
jgi:MFS family permease